MYELTINTDTFYQTNAFYYDKACEHPCPTIAPLVQGVAGTLRVYFVGENKPTEDMEALFAIRPYRQTDDLYRTNYTHAQVDDDGNIYFDLDLNVSTAELLGAMTARETLDVRAGVVVTNTDQTVRQEFQQTAIIARTVLSQNEFSPIPTITVKDFEEVKEAADKATETANEAKETAESIAGVANEAKEIAEKADATANQAKEVAEGIEGIADEAKEIANTVKADLQSEVERATSAEQSLQDAINNEVIRAAQTEEYLQNLIGENTGAIEAEVTRATGVESSLETAIETNASNIEANTTAISEEADRAKVAEQELSVAIQAETTRATEAESELQNSISENASAISAEADRAMEAENALQTSVAENTSAIEGLQVQLANDEVAISKNSEDIEALQSSLADYATVENLGAEATARENADEELKTAVDTNASAISDLQTASSSYVTLGGEQTITGKKTFGYRAAPAFLTGDGQSIAIYDCMGGNCVAVYNDNCKLNIMGSVAIGDNFAAYSVTLNGKEVVTSTEIEDMVTMHCTQTICGAKNFTGGLYVGPYPQNTKGALLVQGDSEDNMFRLQNPDTSGGEFRIYQDADAAGRGDVYLKTTDIDGDINIVTNNGKANYNGAEIATVDDINNIDTSNYVTLSGVQTITGWKNFNASAKFTDAIYLGSSCANTIEVGCKANLVGTWTYHSDEIATVKDLTNYAMLSCVQAEITSRQSADACLKSDINANCDAIASLRSASSCYVTLSGAQTITGKKIFDSRQPVFLTSSSCEGSIWVMDCMQDYGAQIYHQDQKLNILSSVAFGNSSSSYTATLNGKEIATKDDIPGDVDLSRYVTICTLTTGQFTIQGEWHFGGEVQMTNNGYLVDLQEGMLGGKWKMEGKQLATVDDIPGDVDTSNFVTLDGSQTITGQKMFSKGIIVPLNTEAAIVFAGSIGGNPYALLSVENGVFNIRNYSLENGTKLNAWGSGVLTLEATDNANIALTTASGIATYNGNELATVADLQSASANYVDLTSDQRITGGKYFEGTTTFVGTTKFATVVYFDCYGEDVWIAKNLGGKYGCLRGTWRLNGADITTRDVSDALEARITALEEKVG